MANDVFNIATDVEVAIYTYAADAFVWGVTRWDDGDKWQAGGITQDWQAITCSVISVETSNGVTVEQGLVRPDPATARIVFTDPSFDPFVNTTVRSGTPVRIRVRPNPDTAPTTWVTLFEGKIDNSTAAYNYDWVNTVTLDCVGTLRDYLNFTSVDGLTTTLPCLAGEYFDNMNGKLLTGSSILYNVLYDGFTLEGIDSIDPVQFGDLVNQLLDSNLAALVYKPITLDSTNVYYMTGEEISAAAMGAADVQFEAAASANANRAEFSDIVIGFDTAEVVNTVNYSTTLGYSNTRTNDDSVGLLGSISLDVQTLHYYDADADTWAGQLALRLPERRVQQISAPVVLRAGQVNENLLRDPFDVATVSVNNAQIIIEESYFISRVSYILTPDSWDATFELWKGR